MLLSLIKRHLYSTAGEAGIVALADKAHERFAVISDAWRGREQADGFTRFYNAVVGSIGALDSVELRTADLRLRPISGGEVPVGVICKLARAFVEALAEGDRNVERVTLDALAAAGRSSGQINYEVGFRAALAEILNEEGRHGEAVAALEINLSRLPHCPYTQYVYYNTLQEQKRKGQITHSPRVSLEDLSGRFCERPFTTILTVPSSKSAEKGGTGKPELHSCDCAGMLPYPLGGARNQAGEEGDDLWNGPEAQEIRRSIHDGDFRYCAPLVCPWLVQGNLPKKEDVSDPILRDIIDNKRTILASAPRRVSLAHDVSCNIACPTCRSEIMTVRNSERAVMDDFVDRTILPLLRDATVDLIVSGDGDPIASKHYRRLLHNLDPRRHRNVGVYLVSNGLLLTPREWESLSHVQPMIKGVLVSIDAANKETYEDVRRPGKWETLVSNMEFIANLRRKGKIYYFVITFVVQKKNFEQMPAFVELGKRWSVDRVLFSKLFGTLHGDSHDPEALRANMVFESDHPDHARFLEVLRHPIMRSKEVDLFNITGNLDQYLGVDAAVSGLEAAPASTLALEEAAKALHPGAAAE